MNRSLTAKDYLIISLSGVLFASAFFSRYLSHLAWICLVPLFFAIDKKSPYASLKAGIIFGTAANFVGQYWLIGTLNRFGGFPWIVSTIFILILCLYMALQFGLFSYLCTRCVAIHKKSIAGGLMAATIWVGLEYLFPKLFPYGISNSQGFNTILIQVADLFGMYFLSFVVVNVNYSIFSIIKKYAETGVWSLKTGLLSFALLLFVLTYGSFRLKEETLRISSSPKIKAAIVQANFDFFEKNEDNERKITEKHKKMSYKVASSDLIIWPETAVQSWLPLEADYYTADGTAVVPPIKDTFFVIGGLSFQRTQKGESIKYNTAFLLDSNSKILGRYHKIKLLMFGEYLPFSNIFPKIKELSPASGDFTPGKELNLLETSIRNTQLKIGPLICYEDIIPSFSRKLSAKGANILVNLTNDAWFGRSVAPYQHLLISIPRTVETRRYLIRSTNTGISAFIDSRGKVLYSSKLFEDEAVEKEVALINNVQTLYTQIGDTFPIICTVVSGIIVIYFLFVRSRKDFT